MTKLLLALLGTALKYPSRYLDIIINYPNTYLNTTIDYPSRYFLSIPQIRPMAPINIGSSTQKA
jgi:hypothetical protein